MGTVYLTRKIENEGIDDAGQKYDGYIDSVIKDIKSVPDGEDLVMYSTSFGGDIYQGDRLDRAISEHNGKTTFIGVGVNASMAGVLPAAFDVVEWDNDCEIMLHKAHMEGVDELDAAQERLIKNFNTKAYSRLLSKGVDESFLNKVFLSDESKDYWITAKEAERMGFGKAVKIERRDSQPFKVAASLDINKIKDFYIKKNMGLFGKKEVLRVLNTVDGRTLAFASKEEDLSKGDTVQVVGSNEVIDGEVQITDTLKAVINESNEVVDLQEVEEEEVKNESGISPEAEERFAAIEATLMEIKEAMGGSEEAEASNNEAVAALAEKETKLNDLVEEVKDLADKTIKASATIGSSFKLPKIEAKHEKVRSNLTESQKRVQELRNL